MLSGRFCIVVFSWSAGDSVSGRNMALDSSSREVGMCCFRCSSSHYNNNNTKGGDVMAGVCEACT